MLLDKGKMDKITYNLLSNAFKHTPIGGKIAMKLCFSDTDDMFTLCISDSGPGIPPEQRNMLFVRFKQINYTSDGVGVGLHLTSELTKVHKGNIVYSESEWGGACFSVSVPLSDKNYDKANIIGSSQSSERFVTTIDVEQSAATETELIDASVDKPFKDYKVMIVEDSDEVRGFIEDELGKYFSVVSACNGAEALEKVTDEQPDIVVCDVMMPEMNGYEFTKRVKKNFESSHIPVILLTAYSSEEHRLKGIQSGADSYITKPFSTKYLLARIVKLIEQREKLQQKFATEPGLVRPSIGFTDRDKVFLDNLHDIIEKNIENPEFKIETFAQSLGMSRTTFFRKIKGITGYPPHEYVRIMRMKKAAELLTTTDLNVQEISYKVGINDPFYLSRAFKVQFGKSPTQYRKGE
jgi:DNA-binding response OmpR family regulator